MKKLMVVSSALALMLSAGAANACPKGTHPTGGVGPHHKGGTCVAGTSTSSTTTTTTTK